MQLNLKKHYWIVSFCAGGSSATTEVCTKASGRLLFECDLNISTRRMLRTHQ